MERNVTVSNELIRSVQGLSLSEKRLLMIGVSKLDEGEGIEQMIIIPCSEYARLYSMEKKTAYKALRVGSEKLFDRHFKPNPDKPNLKKHWTITADYDGGSVSLQFHPDLQEHVLGLKAHFTRYLLARAGDFKSLYTWRLFELLMQFKSTGKLVIKVDDFKTAMETTPHQGEDFGRIRSKVINPALKELKDKADLHVKLTTIKTGAKITDLKFTFPVEQQTTLPLNQKAAATKAKPTSKPPLSTAQAAKNEQAAAMAHYRKMAEMANVPLETLLPKHLKETETAD